MSGRKPWERLILAALLMLALIPRLREPLSQSVLGHDDPWFHMAVTWEFVQGHQLAANYPPGFALLLSPFALLGPHAFYAFARFAPPFFGVAEVAGMWLLVRGRLGLAPAVAACLVVAWTPENILRTDLLFPTGLDLALLPFLLHYTLGAGAGSRRAYACVGGILAVELFTHPWFVAMALPALGVFAAATARRKPSRVLGIGAASFLAFGGVLVVSAWMPGAWNALSPLVTHAGTRFIELVRHPGSIVPLPDGVDLQGGLGWPLLACAALGAITAARRGSDVSILALAWSMLLLPVVLVDWFGNPWISQRAECYLSVGLAVLVALGVAGILETSLPRRRLVSWGAAATVAILLLPGAATVQPWYRIYNDDDVRAWNAVSDMHPNILVVGSWQAHRGYRAKTALPVTLEPEFFSNAAARAWQLRQHPHLVVFVDRHAAQDLPTAFLANWTKLGAWGPDAAYTPRAPPSRR